MKRRTQEWVDKAEGDWAVAGRELHTPRPVYDVVCFHAHQCAEKYLKAFLEEGCIPFEKEHDLLLLFNLAHGQLPELQSRTEELNHLGAFGIAVRYPGTGADRKAAEQAVGLAEAVRGVVRTELGLGEEEPK